MKITKRTLLELEGVSLKLSHEPVHGSILVEQHDGKTLVGYLVHDPDTDLGDGMGKLYSFHRHAPADDVVAGNLAMSTDPDAVLLDCYDHGNKAWSVHGEGVQCQFDTARGAGVWVPDDVLREMLATEAPEPRRLSAITYCRQLLESYNAIEAGEVYGYVVELFAGSTGTEVDSCWGLIGTRYAGEALREALDHQVATLKPE